MHMTLKIYQVDAFANAVFTGNPAAVCPLEAWLPDAVMQSIAMENNLAETAFYVREKEGYRIRWFTPAVEVDLCGHATLASAHVLFHHENYAGDSITFNSRSGPLTITRKGDSMTLDFPTDTLSEAELTPELAGAFSIRPTKALRGKTDYMLVYENESQIRNLVPDLSKVEKIKARGVIVTAKGDKVDFVSRFFGPQSGVNEDPVTGSAHTTLIPYWSGVLHKTDMLAIQCSARSGQLACKMNGSRVAISGKARTFMIGNIFIS